MAFPLDNRFEKNTGIMTMAEMEKIAQTRVLLVGLGGLGGFVASSLARLGVRSLVLVDYDRFSSSNLNRQLYSSVDTLGKSKVDVLVGELKKINPDIEITAFLDSVYNLDASVYEKVGLIIDAVDEIKTKLFLENVGEKHRKPLLHGAVGGWYGQVGISLPGSQLLHDFYGNFSEGLEKTMGAPTFIPPIIANLMIAELIKFVNHRPATLTNKIMMVDTLNNVEKIVFSK
jgi:molybdopterin-synthase adenylyltransferase